MKRDHRENEGFAKEPTNIGGGLAKGNMSDSMIKESSKMDSRQTWKTESPHLVLIHYTSKDLVEKSSFFITHISSSTISSVTSLLAWAALRPPLHELPSLFFFCNLVMHHYLAIFVWASSHCQCSCWIWSFIYLYVVV